ncbi:DNA primase family protein [Enterococcus hirae]|uniref:DNA primase family protein n=1 Tax=Enterococcus hirae TaxID=1354 RepID=UPI002869E0D6|nr:phage/plasmid primase, P4 family [Enterococcus hirae]
MSIGEKENAFLIGYGSGANGKSLLFALLAKLVGECNTSSSGISAFQSRFGMEVMHNKLLNLATESDVNSFETATLKAVTAGEPITLNRKGIKEITCILPTKFIFLMNHLPLITDSSYGFSRRLLILPFPRTFRPEEQDPFLLEKMTLELSGILNFALEGAKRLIKNGYQFTISDLMNEAKEQFLGCVHPLSYFKAHYLSKNPTRKVESNLLFQTFQKMLKEKNWSARQYGTLRSFNKGLIELFEAEGFVIFTKKSNGKTYLSGIVLN